MLRKERIEKMLRELEYEVSVGILQGDIDERMSYSFIVPKTKPSVNEVVRCKFDVRPERWCDLPSSAFEQARLMSVRDKGSSVPEGDIND